MCFGLQEGQRVYKLEATATPPPYRGRVSERRRRRDPPCPGGAAEILQQPRVQPLEGCVQASVPQKVPVWIFRLKCLEKKKDECCCL